MQYHNPPPTVAQLRAQLGEALKLGTLLPETVASVEHFTDALTRFEAAIGAATDRGATVISGTLELQ